MVNYSEKHELDDAELTVMKTNIYDEQWTEYGEGMLLFCGFCHHHVVFELKDGSKFCLNSFSFAALSWCEIYEYR